MFADPGNAACEGLRFGRPGFILVPVVVILLPQPSALLPSGLLYLLMSVHSPELGCIWD